VAFFIRILKNLKGEMVEMLDSKSWVNAIVGLIASGGSTNLAIHLIAMAEAGGFKITIEDIDEIASITPIIANVYPNGTADVNEFHNSGGVAAFIGSLLDGGYLFDDVQTLLGYGLGVYRNKLEIQDESLIWKYKSIILDQSIIRDINNPFRQTGGLKLMNGNLGKGVIKTSALKNPDKVIKAPAVVFDDQEDVLNAFNEQLVLDLQQAFKNLTGDESVRVIILTGSGKGFSAGADLTEREASWDPDCPSKDALLSGYMPIFNDIVEMPKIVIAAINGPAAGIGAALAMACDLRVMTKSSYILSVFSNIALVPDGGLNWLLTRFLGYAKALEFAIEAKKIDSQMCLDFGIANKVVEDNKLLEETHSWANSLAKRSPQALSNTKRLMRDSLSKSYFETFKQEAEIQNEIFGSSEHREAVQAFFEKRQPKFD
jgi:2-(1,2-epoxy-1,2-dihydrophenyl)acetyl-CoA isomerase